MCCVLEFSMPQRKFCPVFLVPQRSSDEPRVRLLLREEVLTDNLGYACRLWMLKLTIVEFFKRLTSNIWTRSHELTLQSIRWFLLFTFIAVVISDLVECHTFSHYWQVVPDPGPQCRQAYAQLLTMGISNVISDFLLVAFPIPIILTSKMKTTRKIQLVLLFAGSLLPAGTTLYRIPNIIDRHGSQQYRSLLASVEILFATAVANALILGSFVRDRGVKKKKWKAGSMSDSIERTASFSRRGTAIRHWGSDEDLVRDLGMGVDPELRGALPSPRPAPMAVEGNMPVKMNINGGQKADWQFPSDRSDDTDHFKVGESHSITDSHASPRKVSFFDVGGLLDDDIPETRRGSSTKTLDTISNTDAESSTFGRIHSNYSASFEHGNGSLSPTPARKGSSAFLQDVGGLLGPRRESRHSYYGNGIGGTRGYELQTISQEGSPHLAPVASIGLSRQHTHHSLQDVGGLLS